MNACVPERNGYIPNVYFWRNILLANDEMKVVEDYAVPEDDCLLASTLGFNPSDDGGDSLAVEGPVPKPIDEESSRVTPHFQGTQRNVCINYPPSSQLTSPSSSCTRQICAVECKLLLEFILICLHIPIDLLENVFQIHLKAV